jgi:hypothetical protein
MSRNSSFNAGAEVLPHSPRLQWAWAANHQHRQRTLYQVPWAAWASPPDEVAQIATITDLHPACECQEHVKRDGVGRHGTAPADLKALRQG